MSPRELNYRKTAVEGASGFGLLIALYDTLAGDLRRAAEAERTDDIEARSQEVNHALLVIGYLEDWTQHGSSGELTQKLVAFYSSLRRKLIEAQVSRSAAILEQQLAHVLKVRENWQEIESRATSALGIAHVEQMQTYLEVPSSPDERKALSWSA